AAPDLRMIIEKCEQAAARLKQPPLGMTSQRCVERILPLSILGLFVSTGVFWMMSRRNDAMFHEEPSQPRDDTTHDLFRVNYLKALIPLVPLMLLYAQFVGILEVPFNWLESEPRSTAPPGRFDSRLVGSAMLIGVAVAAVISWKSIPAVARAFCEGAGFGFAHIISLIVAASCFGAGIELIGIARLIGDTIEAAPVLLLPAAGLLPMGFAILCGSGMATTQSLFGFFAVPALGLGVDPAHAGAVVSLSAAAGRTMSSVAAVVLM